MMELPEAVVRPVAALRVGLAAEFERDISEADVFEFARCSGDLNPLHTDAEYARSTNLGARVVHGAYQVALASAMAGMYLPRCGRLDIPFGNPATVTRRDAQLAAQAGFDCAFMNAAGLLGARFNRFALPRVHITADMNLSEFEAHISGFYHLLRRRLLGGDERNTTTDAPAS